MKRNACVHNSEGFSKSLMNRVKVSEVFRFFMYAFFRLFYIKAKISDNTVDNVPGTRDLISELQE